MKEKAQLPELLVPAGGREQLEAAILYGADAVYMGGPELSLRTACEGFSGEELALAVADAHAAGENGSELNSRLRERTLRGFFRLCHTI